MLTSEHLNALEALFPEERLGVKAQSKSRDNTKVMLVPYLQHTDVYWRLEQIDPAWQMVVVKSERIAVPTFQEGKDETVFSVLVRISLLGVDRENFGEGGDPKSALSDAIKRAAMLFGVGRYLYDLTPAWHSYNESQDRYRTWTIADYRHAGGKIITPEKVQTPTLIRPQPSQNAPGSVSNGRPGHPELAKLNALLVERKDAWSKEEVMDFIQVKFDAERLGQLWMAEYEDLMGAIKNLTGAQAIALTKEMNSLAKEMAK